MKRLSIAELEQFLAGQYTQLDVDSAIDGLAQQIDRFQVYESLLWPLETVRQRRDFHPEDDALYHSLQVFDLATNRLPFDEEFLLAALLHDVGKAIDPENHVDAGLAALDGFVSDRTNWFIRHHMDVHLIRRGKIGLRALRRLQASESYDELLMLGECDRLGRRCGVTTPDVDQALQYLRDLADYEI